MSTGGVSIVMFPLILHLTGLRINSYNTNIMKIHSMQNINSRFKPPPHITPTQIQQEMIPFALIQIVIAQVK